MMKIAVNGQICDAERAALSVYDHGFLYGMGCFETFRTYQGRPFLLEDHLERLYRGCQKLGIEWNPDADQIRNLITQLLRANELQDAYIRLSVSAGEKPLGLPTEVYQKANTIIYMKELPDQKEVYRTGKPLQRLKIQHSMPEELIGLKTFPFIQHILAKRELETYAWAQGAEGLLLTKEGYLAEGIVSNLFFIRDGILFTPLVSTGIVAGITRAHVINIAKRCGIQVIESYLQWEDLLLADEVFITNSVQEIVPINKVFDEEGTSIHVEVGPMTKRLLEEYRKDTVGGIEDEQGKSSSLQ